MTTPLLDVTNLAVNFQTYAGQVQAVRGVSFSVRHGEVVGIVGESGCGKSVTALSVIGLLPRNARVASGEIRLEGNNILALSEEQRRELRGNDIGMIFQDPMTSLNPTMTVGRQIAEGLMLHLGLSPREALQRAVEILERVGVPNPAERAKQYPHQFSGGMRQRVMIAIALACNPKLLIADEPTTALDVTIQAQILELLRDLGRELSMSIILITHDLGVVAGLCDRVIVMYAGEVAEEGPVERIFANPQHPYTVGLLKSVPRLHVRDKARLMPISGTPPDLRQPPAGCGFFARCPHAMRVCEHQSPALLPIEAQHHAACWLHHPAAPRVDIAATLEVS